MSDTTINAETFFLLSAAVLGTGVISFVVTIVSSRRQMAIEAITKERITWLDELREIASAFVKQAIASSSIHRQQKILVEYSRLNLHLNLEGKREIEVIDLAKEIAESVCHGEAVCMEKVECFMDKTRGLLKQEWEKSKREAGVAKSATWTVAFNVFFATLAASAAILYCEGVK